jgi:hypothetical protein
MWSFIKARIRIQIRSQTFGSDRMWIRNTGRKPLFGAITGERCYLKRNLSAATTPQQCTRRYNMGVMLFKPVLRSRIIFMQLRLRVKILMRLRLRPYCIARQIFKKELQFKYMLKQSSSIDSVPGTGTIFIAENIN